MLGVGACAMNMRKAAVGDERDTAVLQALANLGAITVPECMIHDGGGYGVVLHRDKRRRQGAGNNNCRSRIFKCLLNVDSDKRLILYDEDDAST